VGGSRSSHLLRGIDAQNAHDCDRARNLARQDSRRSLIGACVMPVTAAVRLCWHTRQSPAPGRVGIASGGRL
jgi:hypothetical protein